MVHHAAPDEVVAAIDAVSGTREANVESRSAAARHQAVRRRWLYIGDDCEENELLSIGGGVSGVRAEADLHSPQPAGLASVH
jgi:hypothetical protein